MLSMPERRTLSQWQPSDCPQSGQARASLGTEEPKTPFIPMAAQLEHVQALAWAQALEQREPIFPVLAVAGLPAPGQRGNERSASGVQQGQMPDLRETKEQTGTRAQTGGRARKTGREGSQGSLGSAQNKAGKRKKLTKCKNRIGQGRGRGAGTGKMSGV